MTNLTAGAPAGKKSKVLWFGLALALVTVVVAASLLFLNVRSREADLEAALEQQQTAFINGREQSITLWLDDMEMQGERIVNGDIFRLFASDVNMLEGDISILFAGAEDSDNDDLRSLVAQLPMMRNMLREFASYSGFLSGRIVNSRGETYIASETGVPRLTREQMKRVSAALDSGKTVFSNVYLTPHGLVMDMFMPIFPPQADDGSDQAVSVLVLSRIVTPRLSEFVKSSPTDLRDMRSYLVQAGENNRLELMRPGMGVDSLGALPPDILQNSEKQMKFARRTGVNGEEVYSMGVKIPHMNWWLIEEVNYEEVRTELNAYISTAIGLTVMASLVLILTIIVLWWRLVGNEHRETAMRVQNLLSQIEEQKQLLDAINSTISDLISLTDDKGVIQYANLAFAEAVGRDVKQVVGLDIPALFGFDTGKRLIASDHQVLMSGEALTVRETIWLQSQKHHFEIVKAPLSGVAGRQARGIVSVYRDISELVEAQERSQKVVRQTIDALVRTIEEGDPYLAGHSRFMSVLSSQIARAMNLTEISAATVEEAANLSQIGKMFVPQEILNKPGALTEEEKMIMESHAEHSRRVLQNIEFDLPIVDAIYEMNERLDGTGYPRRLKGEEIGVNARILAVTNAFTAMVRPRSYRQALPVNEVVEILRRQSAAYDQEVVDALERLLSTPAGERLMNTLSKHG
ncbi:MAG: PAS domain-containing protein [Desulfovibrionaceae bacterium]|nr:PAS domain-containing protein [Desulfovibrionaceae bacterium]